MKKGEKSNLLYIIFFWLVVLTFALAGYNLYICSFVGGIVLACLFYSLGF